MSNRLNLFRQNISREGIDAAVIFNEKNQYYLSGFHFSDGLIFITPTEAHLITDFRYIEAAENSVSADFTIAAPRDRTEYIGKILAGSTIRTLGFELGHLSVNEHNKFLSDHSHLISRDITELLESQRAIKDEDEIALISKAQSITDGAFQHILKHLRTDMTEIEVAAELEYFMRKMGADGPAFNTIAVSGCSSSLPHGEPGNLKLRSGFLTLDYGAKYRGYCSDMTRTLCIGQADGEMRKLYETVRTAQQAALDYLREGVVCSDADSVARTIIDSVPEYKGSFGHSLGHGVGLYVHESPSLSQRAKTRKLRAGEIVTVEPGIYLAGKYGVRIEDMVKIEQGGVFNFTKSPKELIEIY